MNDVGVVDVALNLDFSHKLMEGLVWNFGLLDHLEAEYHICGNVPHQVDLSVASLIDESKYCEEFFLFINCEEYPFFKVFSKESLIIRLILRSLKI